MSKRQTITVLLVIVALLLTTVAGVALAIDKQCKAKKKCRGTEQNDTLTGTPKSDIILGLGGDDQLFGLGKSDRLKGGEGLDFLDGGPDDQANDKLDGGGGDDQYQFRGDWGDDVIIDTVVADPSSITGNSVVIFNALGNLTVNLNSDSGPLPEVTAGNGISTINWAGNVIDLVYVRSFGADTITGNSVANFLDNSEDPSQGSGANDSIFAGDGNDIIENGDKSGTDTLSGEGGNDEIRNSDESGPDAVSGGEGNDTIRSLGRDTDDDGIIDTSGGNDSVSGDAGDDTIDVKDGFGGDTVDCGEGTDTVKFDPPDPTAGDPGDVINANCENQNP